MKAIERYERIHLQPPSYRACALCLHGGSCSADASCKHPDAGQRGTVQAMRAPGGACGPEAVLQDFPGLRG